MGKLNRAIVLAAALTQTPTKGVIISAARNGGIIYDLLTMIPLIEKSSRTDYADAGNYQSDDDQPPLHLPMIYPNLTFVDFSLVFWNQFVKECEYFITIL